MSGGEYLKPTHRASYRLPPTKKQLSLLKRLTAQACRTYIEPEWRGEASEQIDELLRRLNRYRRNPHATT